MTDDLAPQAYPQPDEPGTHDHVRRQRADRDAVPEPAVVPRWKRRDPAFDWEERIARALTRDPDWEAKRAKAAYDAWISAGNAEEAS